MKPLIYLIGNDILSQDSLPLQLAPLLTGEFPDALLRSIDPTEDFVPEADSVIIDSVQGIDTVTLFTGLTGFDPPPRLTVHDYDLYLHLMLLIKMHKLEKFAILGIPQNAKVDKKLETEVISALKRFWTSGI